MEKFIAFGILSLPVVFISWRTLFAVKSHGFYRFFSWECIIWIFLTNYSFWFVAPFSIHQLFSWAFLFISVYLVIAGAVRLKKKGKPVNDRNEITLYQFEKTSELVEDGIFRYIRHPLYSSLIFLTWGICLKNPTLIPIIVSILSTAFLYLTAVFDEKECIKYFGARYAEYMKRSRRFVPFIL
jgi:protein-S-isoprenylcysteine O-methyltransferase Ste14